MKGAARRTGQVATLLTVSALLSGLAACGQKGGLYLPDNPPASSRHGSSAAKSATQPATATPAASSATTHPSSAQP
ncbi:hypothetical protein EIP75_06945 [Aquabacterium soli]|uniref:Lipoprotein n=1 Tax=Aquabacterium soli TaxID=2493092 RepID=A0A3R8YPV5_9BURK|nr:hypothetical protein EIP75_06945 [Aquabacterium soli]